MNRHAKFDVFDGWPSRKMGKLASVLLFFFLLAGSEAICQQRPVAVAEPPEFQPDPGIYTYSVRWEQTPAGQATVTVSREGEFYRVDVKAETTKIIRWIYKLKYRGEGMVHREDLSGLKSVMVEETRRRKKETEITYPESGEIKTKVTKTKKNQPPVTEEVTFKPEGEIFDVFSAIFLARSFDWQLGETQEFDVFTGKKRYRIKLVCTDKTIVEEGGKQAEAWVIRPSATDPEKPDEKPKLANTKLYLSADEHRDLLKIKSKGKFGTIKVKIKSYTPLE